MVLDIKIKKQICDFVYVKPRSVDEVALHIGKNWRTADRYVEKIMSEDGCISMRTFREGTRGALKIVYWTSIEKIHSSSFQEHLFKQIENGKEKSDFSPFDMYQYVDAKKKHAFLEEFDDPKISVNQNLIPLLKSAKNVLYVFTGNFSWVNMIEKKTEVIKVLEQIAERGIQVKVLCTIDSVSLENVKKVYAINHKIGKELIEIRHCRQPLRGFVIDDKVARFKEEMLKTKFKEGELKKNIRLFIEIYDKEWIEWLTKVFHSLFRNSIDGYKRIKELETIEKKK